MPVPGCAAAQPGGLDAMMKKAPEQSRPGTARRVLVVVALFVIALAFYVASFLVRH
jgi:hypothetical protein